DTEVGVIIVWPVMCLACVATRRVTGAVLAAVSTPAASVATEKVLKPLAGHLYLYSTYPSGHTTASFALIATTAVLLAGSPIGRTLRTLRVAIVATAGLVGCAISLAVSGLGDHHVTHPV